MRPIFPNKQLNALVKLVNGFSYQRNYVHSFWATVCKTVRPMLSDRCLSVLSCPVLSVCDVGVLWPNGLTHQDETWHDLAWR